MALSAPRTIFGVHSFSPYSRSTGLPYGILKVLEGSSLAVSGELIELKGGSAKSSWQVEAGGLSAELSIKPSEYPDFMFELFMGKAPTAVALSTTGVVSTLTNKYGTSVKVSTTGIASVGITTGANADLKFGKYVIKAASATTVNVYLLSDVGMQRGADGTYQDDNLKITATALTVTTSGAATVVPNFGIEVIGGSGTIGMTTGDTATFEVIPPNSKSMSVTVGSTLDVIPEFGALVVAQKQSTGEMFEIDCLRCKGIGFPIGFDMNAFSKAEVKAKLFWDSTINGLFSIRQAIET